MRNWKRRDFVKGFAALAGTAALPAYDLRSAAAEPPPEIKRIRLVDVPLLCIAPQYLAEQLLLAEGFTNIEYVKADSAPHAIAAGDADMSQYGAPESIPLLDQGQPIVIVAGIHAGCWELFADKRIRSIRELKGKKVAIIDYGAGDHVLLSSVLAYVGIDPRTEIDWVTAPGLFGPIGLFEKGEAEAAFAFPPGPQRVRAKGIGHVILNTARDRPWSQYFCCVINASRDFITRYPIATKRALRAYLKAADVCAQEPERVAQFMASKGYAESYAVQLEVLKSLPYNRWRENSPEDTIRFHALRLHEVGMIKSAPQKLITQGTDWRFFNELKRELKA